MLASAGQSVETSEVAWKTPAASRERISSAATMVSGGPRSGLVGIRHRAMMPTRWLF